MPIRLRPTDSGLIAHVQQIPVEFAHDRRIRTRNKAYYRVNHWPIWIFVFFIAPGPLTFDLFERGFDARMVIWLGVVVAVTGYFGLRGRLPGCEPAPYIIRFTEDRPNPVYRRVCYTVAWGEVVAFAVLNVVGLIVAHRHRDLDAEGRSTATPTSRWPARSGSWARWARCRASSRPRPARATNGATSTARCGRWRWRSRSCGRLAVAAARRSCPTSSSSRFSSGSSR